MRGNRLRGERVESAGKPGSVVGDHSSGMCVTAHLKRPTREPCGPQTATEAASSPIWSCSRWGFPCRGVLPPARCALTAPFHPYRRLAALRRYIFCGTFRRLAPPRRYLAPCPMEPGLSSTPCGTAIAWPTPGVSFKLQVASCKLFLPLLVTCHLSLVTCH